MQYKNSDPRLDGLAEAARGRPFDRKTMGSGGGKKKSRYANAKPLGAAALANLRTKKYDAILGSTSAAGERNYTSTLVFNFRVPAEWADTVRSYAGSGGKFSDVLADLARSTLLRWADFGCSGPSAPRHRLRTIRHSGKGAPKVAASGSCHFSERVSLHTKIALDRYYRNDIPGLKLRLIMAQLDVLGDVIAAYRGNAHSLKSPPTFNPDEWHGACAALLA